MTKLDKMGIKQFHLVCTFIICCLFSFLIKCSKTSLGVVVILPLVMIEQLQLALSGQTGYQSTPLHMYIQNFKLVCESSHVSLELEWENLVLHHTDD